MALREDFPDLRFDGPTAEGVLTVWLDQPERKNAVNRAMHRQLAEVWPRVDREPGVRAVLVRGAGDAFSAGGDFGMLAEMLDDDAVRLEVFEEARALVVNMLGCGTPIVSAINGAAVGAGLTVALLADVPIAGESARLLDGHTRLGVAAGDHAVLVWPLLCGMAKAKRYLLLPDPVDGRQAERIGLVAACVPDDELEREAQDIARRLAESSPSAVRWTKRALNGWLTAALPAFEASLAAEFLGFASADAREGLQALRDRREPRYG